ncbi:MAG: cytochrome c [Deltaproteobacteria bacterium]|nr:cytochrome c [Deltaproteobacteria bacterium]
MLRVRALQVAVMTAAALWLACGGDTEKPSGTASGPEVAAKEAESADGGDDEAEEVAKADDGATETAKQIFGSRCFTCHGAEGAGDGPGSAALNPKPRDFRDASWQDSVSDDHIANIVKFGGAAVGKSPTMPGNPDLMSKPEVVAALVAHVRSLRAQ